jgi:hypothetical protein
VVIVNAILHLASTFLMPLSDGYVDIQYHFVGIAPSVPNMLPVSISKAHTTGQYANEEHEEHFVDRHTNA